MSRRRALYVGFVVVCSLALVVHAGSFTSASAARDVRVNVVSDDSAYLGLSASGADLAYDGSCDSISGQPNVTITVSNQFTEPIDVSVTAEGEFRTNREYNDLSPGADTGDTFYFRNVTGTDVHVVADGPGVHAEADRELCTA